MADKCEFKLSISHGGIWKCVKERGMSEYYVYVKCKTEYYDVVDKDFFGFFDIVEMIKELGLVKWMQLLGRYPSDKYWNVNLIEDDKDIENMLEGMGEEREINIIVDCINKVDVSELEPISDDDLREDSERKDNNEDVSDDDDDDFRLDCINSWGVENEAQSVERAAEVDGEGRAGMHGYELREMGEMRDNEVVISEGSTETDDKDFDLEIASDMSEYSLDDLDFVTDDELKDIKGNLNASGNIFEFLDKDDEFDLNLGEHKESDYSQSDGDLEESDSENDAYNPSKDRIVYDPRCDHEKLEIIVGMAFKDGLQCREALTTWAIMNGRYIRFKHVSVKKLWAKCDKDCPWYVYGSIVSADGCFLIKTHNGDHTCCRDMNNKLVSSKWMAHRYLNIFRIRYNIKIAEIKEDILSRYKTYVPKDRLYKAKALAQELVRGSVEGHYALVRSYLAELTRVGKDGRYELLLGEGFHFRGMYIGLSALRKGFKAGCRPIIGLDGCHLRTYLGGILLAATAKDGNNHMFPIAWAVVGVENESNWSWFLKCLLQDLEAADGEGYTFISEQQKGLQNALALLAPQAEHRNCARHIYMNLKKRHKGTGLQYLFWRTVNSTYEEEFKEAIQALRKDSAAAYEDFMSTDTLRFCRVFISTYPKSDAVDNNVSESLNAWITNARNKHVMHMCEEIRSSLMVRQVEKSKDMLKVNDNITPFVRKKLEKRKLESVDYIPLPAMHEKFEVLDQGDKFVVDVPQNTCSCRVWDLIGFPCIHGISAIQYMQRDLAQYVHDYFSKSSYMSAYSYGIEPIRGQKMWPRVDGPVVKPPVIRRMAGRPRKKRLRAPEEKDSGHRLSRHGTKMTCKNCGQIGHNKRGCKNATVHQPVQEKRRVGRPSKQSDSSTSHAKKRGRSSSDTPSTSTPRGVPFRERAVARQRMGLYTSPTGNSYYHGSMANRSVFHANRGATSRQGSRLQNSATPATQESINEISHQNVSSSRVQ